ncbi:MAG: hypothetical protein LBU04_04280 [Christensenellaceae bacterium]|jgi:glutathione synthase/RimK-type ligase-like ATP-grasp enzyme|nr:hypothetical protein [Christensenellaceae bacterium]
MEIENKERILVKALKEICSLKGIKATFFSYDWIAKLEYKNNVMLIYGYQFPINDAVSDMLCRDKSATFEVLTNSKIRAIEHWLFMSPTWKHYIDDQSDNQRLRELLRKHERIVLKPNEGTSGENVFLVEDDYTLKTASSAIFKKSHMMAVSPYYVIDDEYRIIVVEDEVRLIYRKIRPFVVGDGVSSIKKLAKDKYTGFEFDLPDNTLLPKDSIYTLTWKHNLGAGASAEIITDPNLYSYLSKIAIDAKDAVGIKFASVDIAKTNDEFRVLEINSGVMAEHFSRQSKANYDIILNIYAEMICNYLDVN